MTRRPCESLLPREVADGGNHRVPQDEGARAAELAVFNTRFQMQMYWRAIYLGQGIGIATLVFGVALSVAGISGRIGWIVMATGLTNRLTNTAPGLFFIVIGLIIMWRYKPRINTIVAPDGLGSLMGAPR